MTIGVMVDGRIVQRPYSVASDPGTAGTDGYELYIRLVAGGTFTPLLWRLPVGHGMRMIGPKGKFVLEPEDDRTHIFISSGTGNAPFVAMMRTALRQGRPRRAVFLNGVSYVRDLGYRDILEGWEASGEYPVTFIPTVSRPGDPLNAGWTGRQGRVESIVGPVCEELGLGADNAIAYICGNPDMILAAEQTLLERGFPEAQVKKELYWPKGKEPRGVAPTPGREPVD
jgi:ferredoxin--NADP+ reductase